MSLAISTTHQPASDLGFLLHKHPGRFQRLDLGFGNTARFLAVDREDVVGGSPTQMGVFEETRTEGGSNG